MEIERLIFENMEEMGMLTDDEYYAERLGNDFLSHNEYQLAEMLLPNEFGENLTGEKLLIASSDINLERVALYWYFRMNNGEIFDGDSADDYIPMDECDTPDLIIITSEWKKRLGVWEKAMIPFLLSVNRECNMYTNRIVVDTWEKITLYAFEKGCYFIFDEYEFPLSCDNCEEAADSFFTIVDRGQMNSWIMTSQTVNKCGVFPAFMGPSELW